LAGGREFIAITWFAGAGIPGRQARVGAAATGPRGVAILGDGFENCGLPLASGAM